MSTIKDVAKRAGVSISTVSRALSGKVPVDEKTMERVMEAVQTLDYTPNILARGLKEKSTSTIGLIIPNIQNPVFPAVARGVEDVARDMGYNVILCNTDEDKNIELDYVEKLRKRWVDGFIFATASREYEHIKKIKEQGIPLVLLVRHIGDLADAFVIDNFGAAYKAIEYLAQEGHRKIAVIRGSLDILLYKERFSGCREALKDLGLLEIDDLMVEDNSTAQNGYDAMMGILQKGIRPDAVLALSDPRALGAMRAIRDHGLRIPEDISIMGFDNLDMSALLDPPLTTVSQPLYEMGAKASRRLISIIQSRTDMPAVIDKMETKLIIRGSVANKRGEQ